MTGDDSLALDSITSDYRFMLEHDVSMLEIALAAVSFEDCSLDDAVPLDRASVAYDCWLEALESLHPGHRFRGFGLSDAELADDDLLGRRPRTQFQMTYAGAIAVSLFSASFRVRVSVRPYR